MPFVLAGYRFEHPFTSFTNIYAPKGLFLYKLQWRESPASSYDILDPDRLFVNIAIYEVAVDRVPGLDYPLPEDIEAI